MKFEKITSVYDYNNEFAYFGKVTGGNYFIAHDAGEHGGVIQYVNTDPDIGYDEHVLSGEWLDKHTMGTVFEDKGFWNDIMDYLIQEAENEPWWELEDGTIKGLFEARKYPAEPPYPDDIMRGVRERLGVTPNDTSMDAEIAAMDKVEVMRQWLEWEGICGYTSLVVELVQDIFGVELR